LVDGGMASVRARSAAVQCRAALSLSRNWAMPVGGGGGHGAEQRDGAGSDCAMVKCGRCCRAHIGRPAPISGLRTSPCSPVQYRHAVNISSTYRWTFHQHAALLLSPTSTSNVWQDRQQMDVSGPAHSKCDATSLGIYLLLYGDATRRLVLTLVQCSANS
jgi:hypothetical protein